MTPYTKKIVELHKIHKAIENCGCNKDDEQVGGDSGGGSAEVDYEAIYQFYKNNIIEKIPEEYLEEVIIPEHYTDIENGSGHSNEYLNKYGFWSSDSQPDEDMILLFCELSSTNSVEKYIYFGMYKLFIS